MQKKLTISINKKVYDGLYKKIHFSLSSKIQDRNTCFSLSQILFELEGWKQLKTILTNILVCIILFL